MRRAFSLCLLAAFLAFPAMAQTSAPPATISAEDWAAYRTKFVRENGRVVDDGNGGISHSESQGYGMLLAELAGDRAGFELIWTFTRTELMIRDDGLAAWRWEEAAKPHVTDINNATDGDILIAYALSRAAERFAEPRYSAAAARIARALRPAIVEHGGRLVVMPAVSGFGVGERPDGPVYNPSYLIFEAFPVMAGLDPKGRWEEAARDGMALLGQSGFGEHGLPAEWVSLKGAKPAMAQGFPPQFSYNAIRVPLYLLRNGVTDAGAYAPYRAAWADGRPEVVDLNTGKPVEPLDDAGYRILPAAIACVLDGTALADEFRTFEPGLYYPSTIFLLASSFMKERHPECL